MTTKTTQTTQKGISKGAGRFTRLAMAMLLLLGAALPARSASAGLMVGDTYRSPNDPVIGSIDLSSYCRSIGYARAVLLGPIKATEAWRNWRCESAGGGQMTPNPSDACRYQYRLANVYAKPTDRNDAYSVYCFKGSPGLPPGQNSCKYGSEGGAGIGTESTVYAGIAGKVTGTFEKSTTYPQGRSTSQMNGRLRGCVLGQCTDLAKATADEFSTGGSTARIEIVGKTVLSMPLQLSGRKDWGPWEQGTSYKQTIPVTPIISAVLKFGVGASARASVAWDIKALPPTADLQGQARTSAYGSAAAGVELISDKLLSGLLEGQLNFPAPNVDANVQLRACSAGTSSGKLFFDAYKFTATLKYQGLCTPAIPGWKECWGEQKGWKECWWTPWGTKCVQIVPDIPAGCKQITPDIPAKCAIDGSHKIIDLAGPRTEIKLF